MKEVVKRACFLISLDLWREGAPLPDPERQKLAQRVECRLIKKSVYARSMQQQQAFALSQRGFKFHPCCFDVTISLSILKHLEEPIGKGGPK